MGQPHARPAPPPVRREQVDPLHAGVLLLVITAYCMCLHTFLWHKHVKASCTPPH